MQTGKTFILPPPVRRRLEAALGKFMYPSGAAARDFLEPPGEPALIAHDSVSWRVFANPVTLFIGGVAAVLLELAEPRVRTGVWEHTSFRDDPVPRLRRTGYAAMMTVYGPRTRAEEMIARIGRLHGRIAGLTPDGQAYRADQPELLDWVQATASFGFLEAWHAYVRPDADLRDRFYAEAGASARLYGATGAPASQRELAALFARMEPLLEASPIVADFLGIMRRAPILPRPLAPVQGWLIDAAVDILPPWVRQRLALHGPPLRGWRRRAIAASAVAAGGIPLRTSPAVLSCRRLGLPEDYLHRSLPDDAGRPAA